MIATTDARMPKSILVKVKTSPSIAQEIYMMKIDNQSSWINPIVLYMRDEILPVDKTQPRKLKCQAARYALIDGVFYR